MLNLKKVYTGLGSQSVYELIFLKMFPSGEKQIISGDMLVSLCLVGSRWRWRRTFFWRGRRCLSGGSFRAPPTERPHPPRPAETERWSLDARRSWSIRESLKYQLLFISGGQQPPDGRSSSRRARGSGFTAAARCASATGSVHKDPRAHVAESLKSIFKKKKEKDTHLYHGEKKKADRFIWPLLKKICF